MAVLGVDLRRLSEGGSGCSGREWARPVGGICYSGCESRCSNCSELKRSWSEISRFADLPIRSNRQIWKSGSLTSRPLELTPRAHSNTEIRFQNSETHPQAIPIHPQSVQIHPQTDDKSQLSEHPQHNTKVISRTTPKGTRSTPTKLNGIAFSGTGS